MAALTRRGLLAGLGAGVLGVSLASCADESEVSLPSQGALVSVGEFSDLLTLDQAANAAIIADICDLLIV